MRLAALAIGFTGLANVAELAAETWAGTLAMLAACLLAAWRITRPRRVDA